jgi:8-oxo-dGTP pyrophosphatase MutT (NUDIX family)
VGHVRAHDAQAGVLRRRCALRCARQRDSSLSDILGRCHAAAVVVFAVLRSAAAPPHTLLVKQFRPPVRSLSRAVRCPPSHPNINRPNALQMGTFTIELPAGLIDPGEDAATAALRELKEETGYVATVRLLCRCHARTVLC